MKNFINRALAAKKKIFSLFCALSALLFLPVSTYATDYTIEPKADGAAPAKSRAIPLRFDNSATWGSVSQQIYLASELIAVGAGAGDIEAISFYYGAVTSSVNAQSRPIQIFIMQVPSEGASKIDSFVVKPANAKSDFLYVSNTNKTAGTRVYEGALATEAVNTSDIKKVKINFDNSFTWDGSSNIVLTVFDMSPTSNTISSTGYTNLRFMISKTDHPRFLSKKWMSTDTDDRATKNTGWIDDISNNLTGREGEYWTASAAATVPVQSANRSYVNKVDFSITTTPAPSTPTGLAANDISTTSASISWNAASSATSYELQSSNNGEDWSDLASSISGTSYNWTGLSASTTYHVRVRAVNAVGNSDWSDAILFTTEGLHTHNGITFEKWNSTSSLPTSGNYYLANDVELSAGISLSGNLNLCLNGHRVFSENNIAIFSVPDKKTLAIYDNVGGGRIYGYYEVDGLSTAGIITVESGGTLVLGEGSVENLDVEPEDGYSAYAIYNKGTFKLSGSPVISGHTADIGLFNNRYITIESGKPLTNSTPYSVNSGGQVITSGWANMGGAHPSLFFTSRKSGYSGVSLVDGEATLVHAVDLSDAVDNSSVIENGANQGVAIVVNMTRSLTSAQYNTFCLPFALSDAQLQTYFGSDYDLEEFTGASIVGDVLELEFTQRNALEAGKPYLLKPSVNVSNPTFDAVVIMAAAETPSSSTSSEIDFIGVYSPTELEGENKNLLFLGANDELFWPASTGNLKGFRVYFEVKGSAAKAAKHARIVKNESQTRAIDNIESTNTAQKRLIDGQLFIEKNGTLYNACGQRVK